MDIIPMNRFEVSLKTELDGFRRPNRKSAWSDLLVLWAGRHFLQLDDSQLLRACGMRGPGEEGIDLFWVEHGGKRVIVGQAEASVDLKLSKTFSRGIIDKLRRAVAALNDPELAENRQSPIANAIDEYNDSISKGYSIEFWAIIGGAPNKGLERAAKRFQQTDLRKYAKHGFQMKDAAALLTQYCANVERMPYPDITLELPRHEYFRHGDNSILATVSAESVAREVKDKGLHIFESNARLPLLRSDTNKEIAATLGDSARRHHFWTLNNGLTILCSDFSSPNNKIRLRGAQIVNGCQTAYTLSKNIESLDRVEVMCRIICRATAAESERIRRATNLQNQILERDLRSGDRVQKMLQMGFRRRGYYYERKRDEYKNSIEELGKVNIVAQFPNGMVDNLYLAQLALAFWHEKPAPAKMQVKKLFVKASALTEKELPVGFYDIVFPDYVAAEDLLLPFLVSNHLYDDFKIGYRPQGVKRTKKYMVQTHGNLTILALLGRAIRFKYRLEMPLQASRKQLLGNLLIPRFERPSDHPEFFTNFNRSCQKLLNGIYDWVNREAKRQEREEGLVDIRKMFISATTLGDILGDRRMRQTMKRAQTHLPELDG